MNAKDIRKQVRNVMQEQLAEVLASEVIAAIEKRIVADVNKRLEALHKQVEASLKAMDAKVSDGVSYLVRHTGQMPMSVKLDKKD